MAESIVIVSAARTPIGGLLGDFASLAAWELGAVAIKAAVERAGVPGDAVDEVLFGNCLMAGQGQAPARQALRRAGLPDSSGAVTLSKMCGSGMRAMMFAPRHARGRQRQRGGRRRHGEHDQRAAPDVRAQGHQVRRQRSSTTTWRWTAWRTPTSAARRWACSPSSASASTSSRARRRTSSRSPRRRAARRPTRTAASTGRWRRCPLPGKSGDVVIKFDEQPFKAKLDKIPGLKPAFKKDGTITAANSSSISDGAAALVLMRESTASADGREADRPHRRPCGARTGARVVRHGAGRCDRQGAEEDRLGEQGRGPVGGQRGLRRGDDGGDGGVQAAA